MIVGLCGTHGTGKSTIINGIRELNFPVNDIQLSRAVQQALGWESLDRVKENEDTMWQFQEAILGAMYDRDQQILESKTVTLVERTPADVWAYTSLWCSHFSISLLTSGRARKFKNACNSMASKYCLFLFLPIREEVKFVHEVNRASEKSRLEVESSLRSFLDGASLPVHEVESVSKQSRISECYSSLILEKAKHL